MRPFSVLSAALLLIGSIEYAAAQTDSRDPFSPTTAPGQATEPDKPRPRATTLREAREPRLTLTAGRTSAGEQAILKALDEPAVLEFNKTPFHEVFERIQKQYNIPVVIDRKGLEELGVSIDMPVTASISHAPLHSALDLMLDDLQLTWTVKSDVLFITSFERDQLHLIVKSYDVIDLILPTGDRPYRGDRLPGVSPDVWPWPGSAQSSPQMCGLCGNGMSSSMPANGNGMRERSDENLIDLITSTVQPSRWDAVGGPGSIAGFQHFLVISQSFRVHREIKALLDELRAKRQAAHTVVIEFHGLWLNAAQHRQLVGDAQPTAAGQVSLAVDPKVLALLAVSAPGYHGQIACANGQLVHVASGDRRAIIANGIPVIGDGAAYQPVVQVPNVGVVLEFRPRVVPDGNAVLLDVDSTVTRWSKLRRPAQVGSSWPPSQTFAPGVFKEGGNSQQLHTAPGGSATIGIDQPVMPAQQFATTVCVPLGKPVILGAMTFPPSGGANLEKPGSESLQLYVIATTSLAAVVAK